MRHAFWFKRGIMAVLTWMVVLGLIACGPQDKDPDPDPDPETPSAITTVLETYANGDEAYVAGTIYYAQANGFYLYDSGVGFIFVQDTATLGLPLNDHIGKAVEVTGTFSRTGDRPTLTQVTDITVTAATGTLPTAQPTTVSALLAGNPAQRTGVWYQYVELRGEIVVDQVTLQTMFVDDTGTQMPFSTASSLDAFAEHIGHRVTLSAVLGEYSTIGNAWRLIYVGTEADIVPTPFTLAEVESMLDVYFAGRVPTHILGTLTLPAQFSEVADLTIEWSTDLTEWLDIRPLEEDATDYDVEVTIPLEDVAGTLTATIFYGSYEPFDLVFPITVQELEQMTLAAALESERALVLFEAVVIGFASTQTDSARSILVQDLVHADVVITVDYSRLDAEDYGLLTQVNPQIGDVVLVAGSYRQEGRPSIVDAFITELTGATALPVYDFDNAPVLDTQANWETFPGHNTLVRIVNPYMRYSTSSVPSPTNWIRLGYDLESVGTNFGANNDKSYAFLIRPIDAMLGESWRTVLDIPVVGNDPVMYDGDIFAYIVYETPTYIQMVIVDPSHVNPSPRQMVVEELYAAMPTRVEFSEAPTSLDLLTTHAHVDDVISWQSSNLEVVSHNGDITFPETDVLVTLTASFAIDGVEAIVAFDVMIAGGVKVILQVDEVLDVSVDEDRFFIEGIVLAAGYNTAGNVSDIFLQDKTSGRITIVQGLTGYGEDFHDGDLVEFYAQLNIVGSDNEPNKRVVLFEAQFKVLEADYGIGDYRQHAIVIDSHEAALALLALDTIVYGGVYKFTGNFFLRNTASAWNPGALNNALHMNPDASGIADTRYGTKRPVLNDNGNRGTLGENWVEDILGITEDNRPGLAYPGFSYFGSVYAVVKNGTNFYFYLSVISPEDFIFETPETEAAREIAAAIPAEIAGGDLTLPETHPHVDGAIVWQSSHPAVIDPSTGIVTYGVADVDVTLTAMYDIDGVAFDIDVVIKVLSVPLLSVTDVVSTSTDGETVRVEGIVVGFHWNGSGSRGPVTNGVLIKETTGNTILYVTGLYGAYGETLFEYDVDGHVLALGDHIALTATYQVTTDPGFAGRQTLHIESAVAGALVVVGTGLTYGFDLEAAVVIDTDEAFTAAIENLTYGQLFKLEGAFFMRASASAYGNAVNMVPSYTAAALADFNTDVSWFDRPQRLSFKFDANAPNLGANWWETYLNINADNYGGTALEGHAFAEGSSIYFYVGHALPTAVPSFGYIQLVILDPDWIDVTRILE